MTTIKVNGQFVQYDKVDTDADGRPVYSVMLRGEPIGGLIHKPDDEHFQAFARNGLPMPARDTLNAAVGDVLAEVGRDYRP